MCTYEDLVAATLPYGLTPLVVPQLQDHHPRRRGQRPGHRVGVVPQRSATRIGAGNGHPHRRRRIAHRVADAASDLFRAFPNSYGTLGYSTRLRIELEPVRRLWRCGTSDFTRWPRWSRQMDRIIDTGGQRRHPGRLPRRRGLQPRRKLPVRRQTNHHPGTGQRLHRQKHLLPVDSARQRRREDIKDDRLTIHDYLWRWDTDWFWCSRAFGAQNPRMRRWWPRRYRRSSVYWKLVALDRRFGSPTGSRSATAVRHANGWCRTSRCRSSGPANSWSGSWTTCPSRRSGCARCGFATTTAGRCIRSGRTAPTSTSGSGRRCRPAPADGETNRAIEAKVSAARRSQVAVFRRLLHPRRV